MESKKYLDNITDSVAKTKRYECIICTVNQVKVILYPCCHACMCGQCAKDYINISCPICRKPVRKFLKIYISESQPIENLKSTSINKKKKRRRNRPYSLSRRQNIANAAQQSISNNQ